MKKILLFCLFAAGTFSAHAQYDCSTAYQVTPGSYFVDSVNGTQIPNPVCIPGATAATAGMWYVYTPTENHTVTVSTDLPINNGRNTRFQVYRGNCDNLICHGGDDDSGTGNTSIDSFAAQVGWSYYIAFDNKWSSQGFTFELTEGPYVVVPVEAGIAFSSQTIVLTGEKAVVDMNGDFLDDIVGVNQTSVNMAYQSATGSGFTMATLTTPSAAYMPGWSMAAGDIDNNGFNDLLYGSGSGVSFMKQNNTQTAFTQMYTTNNVFSQRSNFVDLDNDGHLDAFVCHDVAPNVYYTNDGFGNYTFHQGGMGDFPSGGNYGSIFVDYDNDGDQDMFIAKCRGGNSGANIDELHQNNGDGTFTNVSLFAGMAEPSQSWSSAWGDFDNDGDMDALIGASSFATGGHKLMRNNGDGTFTDITAGSGFEIFSGTDHEHVAHDFNNDGWIDIFAGAKTIMINNGSMNFSPLVIPAGHGPIGDLNNDGFLDILNNNFPNTTATLYLHTGNDNNWIKVQLQGVLSNRSAIGARVEIYGIWGKQIRDVRSGDGFEYMSSLNTHFGIGPANAIEKVIIRWPSGTVDTVFNPNINEPLTVIEGSTLGTTNFASSSFSVYPNPTDDLLNIKMAHTSEIKTVEVYDLTGRKVLDAGTADQFSVKALSSGTYILLMKDNQGRQHSQKFIKK
ncbi:FG-GAP-like repeat-containing protein [Flavobacterium sp.]|uniref:FG-GAP-like repeat-containing protein n=1 Tax=Flavobacterium sp. TaxID=239 RepID=UPI0039E65A5A